MQDTIEQIARFDRGELIVGGIFYITVTNVSIVKKQLGQTIKYVAHLKLDDFANKFNHLLGTEQKLIVILEKEYTGNEKKLINRYQLTNTKISVKKSNIVSVIATQLTIL